MTPDLSVRSLQSEMMDAPGGGARALYDCLRQLAFLNLCTLTYRPTLRWLGRVLAAHRREPLHILDVGSGGGDMARRIWKRARRGGHDVSITGIDINPLSVGIAAAQTPPSAPIRFEAADIFSFAPARRCDYVISSLFTHHLADDDLIRFLRWMTARARIGWFVNDLHRHALPYHFIRSVMHLIPANRMVRHDAPVSVARAFTRQDWDRLLVQAGLDPAKVSVEWFFPFRYGVGFTR